jgi:hypothetical protein
VLVRLLWRAEVRLEGWEPRFEMTHRRVVPPGEALWLVTAAEEAMGPIYRRLFAEAAHAPADRDDRPNR